MRKTTIGALCICRPSKCYGAGCQYCKAAECVQGKEVTLGIVHDPFVWVLIAGFSPFPIGIAIGVILQMAGK